MKDYSYEPGIYENVPAEKYHADALTPEPSLSASLAWTLITRSPAHAWTGHPRLNPAYEREEKAVYDLGTAAHHMVLRQAFWREEIVVIDAADWRTVAAREKRDRARTQGLVPILSDQYAALERMVETLEQHPEAGGLFAGGTPEVTIIWRDDETGIWLRCRPDWRPMHDTMPWPDYKTTGDANPESWDRIFATDHGGLLRAAMYQEGIRRVCGVDNPTMCYVVQEKTPPHSVVVRVVEGSGAAMEIGRRMFHKALQSWAACTRAGVWPSYDLLGGVTAPVWMEKRWLEPTT